MSDNKSIWDDPRITAYVLGELNAEETATFLDEIKNDSELAAAIDEARGVTGRLSELYAAEPASELDPHRRDAIAKESSEEAGSATATNAVTAASAAHPDVTDRRSMMPKLLLATAAVVLLLVGIAPLLNQPETQTVSQLAEDPVELTDERVLAESRESLHASTSELADSVSDRGGIEPDSFRIRQNANAEATMGMGGMGGMGGMEMSGGETATVDATVQLQAMPSPNAPQSGNVEFRAGLGDESEAMLGYRTDANGSAKDSLGELTEHHATDFETVAPASRALNSLSFSTEDQPFFTEAQPAPTREARFEDPQSDLRKQVPQQIRRSEVAGNVVVAEEHEELGGYSKGVARAKDQDGRMSGGADEALGMRAMGGMSDGLAIVPSLPGQPFGATPDYGLPIDEGRGPGIAGDRFEPITDNPFKRVAEHPLSTFSIDVDTASYSKVRDFLTRANQLPRPDAVRIEEMVNYFDYDYQPPANDDPHPFAAHTVITDCPWNDEHMLARIALKGKTMTADERPKANLVFLLDTSGSMNADNKLPLVVDGMKMLLKQLNEDDKVAVTVYAGSAGLVLDSTKAAKGKKIRKALTQLQAGGSTNGGSGIALAYQTARDNFIPDGVNRIILCTDGDFNVGTTGTDELVRMVEREAKGGIFLSVLGFGMGNHNDAMLEQISNRGNGNYAFIDTDREARKVLVDQTSATLVTIAKDVKIQIEFNPRHVASYRLIGYENRILAKEDFNDDKKDAGEIGAGHTVTALYELVPAGKEPDAAKPKVDDLTFQSDPELTEAAASDQWMLLKLRYKQPDGDTSTLVKFPVTASEGSFEDVDNDVRFAAAVAGFGMQLRRSEYRGDWTLSDVRQTAEKAMGEDKFGIRAEFITLVEKAANLMGEE